MMPARFALDGREEGTGAAEEQWPNFQTDCYGFWLWALADHVTRGGQLDDTLDGAARLVIAYLLEAGELPCYDCWEEHPGHVHTSSLAAVAAGPRDAGTRLGDSAAQELAARLTTRLTGPDHTVAGAYAGRRIPAVDGRTVPPGRHRQPAVREHLTRISDELAVPAGGIRRYLGDTFYGGSEWILLAATYGWVALTRGDSDTAHQMLSWIEGTATDDGYLPEQIQDHVQSPYMLRYWRRKSGATATPLLWSHAMHIVLADALG